jgi:hypothetical protein
MWRSLRRRILTPNLSETKVGIRGFHVKSAAAVDRLETVGHSFLTGYAAAAGAARPQDVEARLSTLSATYRGFAYEGAAMALAVLDGLPVGGRRHVEDFLAGPGQPHVYMVYVGVGWAMARLPRFRWPVLHAPDPLLRWLVLDGYGFHQAYFRTRQYVHERLHEDRFPWPVGGPSWHAAQVIDQGVGRASWFVGGADPARVAAILDAFPEHRRADLYSGAGLAATYAGGVDRDELEHFAELAGPYLPQLAQGAAFAAKARLHADLVVPHNELATQVFCGMTVEEAAAITDRARVDLPGSRTIPDFAVWRQRIASEFATRPALPKKRELPNR